MDNMLNLADSYWKMLKSLSKEAKLNLIAKLSNSIIETPKYENIKTSSWTDSTVVLGKIQEARKKCLLKSRKIGQLI